MAAAFKVSLAIIRKVVNLPPVTVTRPCSSQTMCSRFSLDGFSAPVPITESRATSLWHNGLIFGLILGCWIAEWAWRRWKGLP